MIHRIQEVSLDFMKEGKGMLTINDLKYNHHGLIPAIVVDASTRDV